MSNGPRSVPGNRRLAKEVVENERLRAEPWDPDALWRNLRAAGRVLLAISVLAVGVGAAVAARRYVTKSPRFGLHDLKIEGNHRRTEQELLAQAGVTVGQNVVEIDLEAVRARLEKDPWIERATVTRKLPASLSIDVVEREAAAIVALPTGVFVATPEGVVFKRVEEGDPVDLPVVTGLDGSELGPAPTADPNRPALMLDGDTRAQLVRRALDLAAEIERVGVFGGRVQELHVEPDGGVTAAIGKRAVRVAFGKASYRAKVRLAARIEAELSRRGAKPTCVFLDDDAHADRVVVRLVRALPPAEVVVDDDGKNNVAKGNLSAGKSSPSAPSKKLAKKGKP